MSLRSIDNFPSSRFPPTYVGFGILYILGNLIKAKIMSNDGKVMEYWTACVPERGLSAQMQGNEEMMK